VRPELRVLPDANALAQHGAAEFVRRCLSAVGERGRFAVALAGGSTPRGLYSLLARRGALVPPGPLPWPRVHLFWGDERHVPPDHADSNYRLAREAWLAQAPVPPENVHRIRGELPEAESAAQAYEQELRFAFGLEPGELPRFDLVLLGLGADGHVASLFPGHPALAESRRLAVAPYVEPLAAHRITLTFPVFNRAAAVVFLVAGAEKAPALRRALAPQGSVAETPARGIHPENGDLLWMVDEAAASGLDRRA
jgi:6-phosphogluconolactonase